MTRLCRLILVCLMLGTGQLRGDESPPSRVVSINLCTDQLLLMLAQPQQIASISYLARDPESSFVAKQAISIPINHARLEELIAHRPDLILAGAHTNPRLLSQLQRLGLAVERFPLTHSIAGIRRDIRRLARLLGHPQRGEQLIDEMQAKIALSRSEAGQTAPRKALFYQPRGYTSGGDTLQDEALNAAGWRNLADEMGIKGYAPIDLETLLMAEPDQLFTSSHTPGSQSRAQQQLHHPALRRLLTHRPLLEVPFKYWLCAGPMIAEAIAILHTAHDR